MVVLPASHLVLLAVVTAPQLIFGIALDAVEQSSVRAGTPPQITVVEYPLGTDTAIEVHISALATIGSPSDGYMPWMTALNFAPVPSTFSTIRHDELILGGHVPTVNASLTALVAEGPRAWPHLLQHLDDNTLTRMSVPYDSFHSMFNVGEMPTNPISPFEVGCPSPGLLQGGSMVGHIVTVGDICFVVLGQILGRPYAVVRGEGFDTVINSPTKNSVLLKAVRRTWQTTSPRQRLLDSLLVDYATQGIYNGRSSDGLDKASTLQCSAALRLLYYFPEQTDDIIATTIDHLNLVARKPSDPRLKRDVDNAVNAKEFLTAVSWSTATLTAAAVRRAFDRAQVIEEVLAALPPVATTAHLDRLVALVDTLPAEERGSYGDGYQLIHTLLVRDDARAQVACTHYLTGDIFRRRALCVALESSTSPWAIALISKLLDDRRINDGWSHPVGADSKSAPISYRVCDFALEALLKMTGHTKVEISGTVQELDQQIAALRKRLNIK